MSIYPVCRPIVTFKVYNMTVGVQVVAIQKT